MRPLQLLITSWLTTGGVAGAHSIDMIRVSPDVAHYLDDWAPLQLGDRTHWKADFVVAQDGTGTHTTVQAALDALPHASMDQDRHYVLLKPGTYREIVCLRDKVPFTLYGQGAVDEVVIVESRYNAMPKPSGQIANPCYPALSQQSYGTFGSATMNVHSSDVQLAGFTVMNEAMNKVKEGAMYPPGAGESGGAQAVALSLKGDRIHLNDMHLLGHQDTFFADKAPNTLARIYVEQSLIAGDEDFIFGAAQLVIENSLIVSRFGRRAAGQGGHVLAPSTAPQDPFGFLVINSQMLGQPGLTPQSISLGRPWDHGVKKGEWKAGRSPNGQLTITQTQLGMHLGQWGRSTSNRESSQNGKDAFRFHSFGNSFSPENPLFFIP